MKTLDRLILAAIAVALSAIALNPWVAPGYVTAQGMAIVDLVMLRGNYISDKNPLPVEIVRERK